MILLRFKLPFLTEKNSTEDDMGGVADSTDGVTPIFHNFITANPPHRPHSKGPRWLPDWMEESRPVRTKALYPIFADRRTRTGTVLKQLAGEGLT